MMTEDSHSENLEKKPQQEEVLNKNTSETQSENTDDAPQETGKESEVQEPTEVPETQEDPVEETPAVVTPPSLSLSLESTAPANTVDQSDPLVQSFPQLNEVNEIHLNLELAEQYIQLGAFEAARKILVEQEPNYSTEQRQQVEQLLSRIAS